MFKTYDLETEMMRRWQNCIERNGFSVHRANLVWPGIVLSYSEKHRHYHNLTHIKSCLDVLDSMKASLLPADVNAIEFAIWFHDIVYDTQANDNEEKSADQARFIMKQIGLDPLFRANVVRMIHLTKHLGIGSEIPLNDAEKLFLDIDLSILGALGPVFDEYCDNIRKEYSWVPEEIYNQKRQEVLQGFLNRDRIFHNEHMFWTYEGRARLNLTLETQEGWT